MDEERLAAKRKKRQQRWVERQERSRLSRSEIEELRQRRDELRAALDAEDADPNTSLSHNFKKDQEENNKDNKVKLEFTHFNQLPLSQRTQLGLERGGYTRMTPIQTDTMHLALAGYDVLGAARTGSGKTLCFVIPVLEKLFVEQWDPAMGLGALVLSPTRELALQIFKVLQLVGHKHVLSAALLTGGRDVGEERKRLAVISIIIGTPGRVLHHLEDDATLVTDNLQIFAMDEADRLLDMGFRETITGILQHLPSARQTLLFSATQTTDVQMLAQLSLRNQRYVTAHAITAAPTPATLCQNFIVIELHRKLDALFLFLKRHPNDKIVVFVSTCNQVRFMYLAFAKILKKMRIPCMCLTSKMKQFRREEVFLTFCRCKAAVLFCTDVAARGLDFPLVHWSVQYDCPDSAQTYIHRAGRSARAGARGVSLLFLTPRETPMLSFLAHKHVPLREIAIRPGLLQESREIFVALVVQGLKYEAQKAFIAYLRSVYFASNKLVFDVNAIDVAPFAHSLGLLKVPDMSELQNLQRGAKNLPWDVVNYIARRNQYKGKGELEDGEEEGGQQQQQQQQQRTRREKHLAASDLFRTLQQKQRYTTKDDDDNNNNNNNNNNENKKSQSNKDDDGDDFLVKRPRTNGDAEGHQTAEMQLSVEERMAGLSKRKVRKYIETADLRVRDLGLSKRTVFADDEEDEDEEDNNNNNKNKNKGGDAGSDASDDDDDVLKQEILQRQHHIISSSNARGAIHNNNNEELDGIVDYAARLRQRVMQEAAEDAERAKRLRRLRRLQRDGKIAKRTALDDSGVSAAIGGKRPKDKDGSDEDDYDYENDDDSVGSTGSLSRLIKAAKGELYSDDDDDDDDDLFENEGEISDAASSISEDKTEVRPNRKKVKYA